VNRLDVLNSPEADAIRNRAKAAREANRRKFEVKVDAIPGIIEAWNKQRSHLDKQNRLWDRYEEMVKPLRAELDVNALHINMGMASTVGVTEIEAEAIYNKWELDHAANRQVYEEKRKALPGCLEIWNEWKSRKDKQNKIWSKYEELIKPLREEMEAEALRINNEESKAMSKLVSKMSGESQEELGCTCK